MAKSTIDPKILLSLSEEIASVAEEAARAVVSLDSRGAFPTSATIWEADHLVTANHVIGDDEGIKVTDNTGRELEASVAGRDPGTDLALLRSEGIGDGLPGTVSVDGLAPGKLGLALSRNSEHGLNVSLAVINAIGGEWTTPYGGRIDHFLRLDVSRHAGFSGGPLVDPEGRLIGIDSSRLSRRSAVALPVVTVSRVVAELKEHGFVRRGYLGISSLPADISAGARERHGLTQSEGLMILQTEQESVSEKAGVLQGDILLDLDGVTLRDPRELVQLLGPQTVGRRMKARFLRAGKLLELEIEIGVRPRPDFHARRRGRGWMHHRGGR